jgi:hypothetical protein
MRFREWLEINEGATSGKTGLYPLGYGGIGLYPPQTYLPPSADGLYYLTQDDRIYKGNEGKPFSITHISGRPSHKGPTPGEGEPWNIKKLPGKPSHQKIGQWGIKSGDGEPWKINHLK